MKNLIKYHYEQAKECGIEQSPTEELVELGFRGLRINYVMLPQYIIYEASNLIEELPGHIELYKSTRENSGIL